MLKLILEEKSLDYIAAIHGVTYDSPEWVGISFSMEEVIRLKGEQWFLENGYELEDESVEFEANRIDVEFENEGVYYKVFLYFDESMGRLIAADTVLENSEGVPPLKFVETELYHDIMNY